MVSILEDMGSSIGDFSWASIGQVTFVIAMFLMALLLLGGVSVFLWWKSYHLKVKIYEPFGQVKLTDKDMARIKAESLEGKTDALNDNKIKFDTIRVKTTHGKFTTVKGDPYFNTFMPFRRHEPVPMEMMFEDGIHLLRLSREIYIPIVKPKTIIEVGETVSISVTENNKWKVWNNMMAEKINSKYQDADVLKRTTLYFVVGIVALVLIGGFILWLIYSTANKGWDAAEKFNVVADALLGGSKPA